jgi:hypothetical protein
MAKLNKIRKDCVGLYVNCGGYVSRPFWGTSFSEGDMVKTTHVGGSVMGKVTTEDLDFKWQNFEYWCTCGMGYSQHKKATDVELESDAKFYEKFTASGFITKPQNEAFKNLLHTK